MQDNLLSIYMLFLYLAVTRILMLNTVPHSDNRYDGILAEKGAPDESSERSGTGRNTVYSDADTDRDGTQHWIAQKRAFIFHCRVMDHCLYGIPKGGASSGH